MCVLVIRVVMAAVWSVFRTRWCVGPGPTPRTPQVSRPTNVARLGRRGPLPV